jgi:hypothetical protein
MKLKEYIQNLQEIAEKHPNLEVVYAKDEERNGYEKVCFSPTLGNFKDGEFTPEENFGEYGLTKKKLNCVVIN